MEIEIKNALVCPESITQIIEWQEREWANRPLYRWMRAVNMGLATANMLPSLFIAFRDRNPIGCVALVHDDMDDCASATENPWLAHLYVLPEYRGAGYGATLFDYAETAAHNIGIQTLYLFTSNIQSLAISRGWLTIRNQYFENENVFVMKKRLV